MASVAIEVGIAREALKGSVLEISKRQAVSQLSYPLVANLALQFSTNALATHWVATSGPLCPDIPGQVDPQEVMLGLVVSLWLAAGFFLLVVLLVFNLFPNFTDERSWERRCACVSRLLCCAGKVQQIPAEASRHSSSSRTLLLDCQRARILQELALSPDAETILIKVSRLFAYLFKHVDLVPSDVTAGFYLVALKQRTLGLGTGALRRSSSPTSEPLLGSPRSPPVAPEVLEEALHWAQFAQGAYGWALYLWTELSGPIGLLGGLGKLLFGVGLPAQLKALLREEERREIAQQRAGQHASASAFQRTEAKAIALLSGVPRSDLVFVSRHNLVTGKLPYFIALDRARRTVVLSIRGTMSLDDALTDILCGERASRISSLRCCRPGFHPIGVCNCPSSRARAYYRAAGAKFLQHGVRLQPAAAPAAAAAAAVAATSAGWWTSG